MDRSDNMIKPGRVRSANVRIDARTAEVRVDKATLLLQHVELVGVAKHFGPEREHRGGVDDGPDRSLQSVDVRKAGGIRQEVAVVHLVLVCMGKNR